MGDVGQEAVAQIQPYSPEDISQLQVEAPSLPLLPPGGYPCGTFLGSLASSLLSGLNEL